MTEVQHTRIRVGILVSIVLLALVVGAQWGVLTSSATTNEHKWDVTSYQQDYEMVLAPPAVVDDGIETVQSGLDKNGVIAGQAGPPPQQGRVYPDSGRAAPAVDASWFQRTVQYIQSGFTWAG